MRCSKTTMLAKKVALLALGAAAGIFLADCQCGSPRPDLGTLVLTYYIGNRSRIHANPRELGYQRHFSTDGQTHLVFYNSLGLRQHREFTSRKPPGVVRVGLFGDSFAENNRLPVQYSLSEVLDFLLNRTGRFEDCNFGTDNYGTDQIIFSSSTRVCSSIWTWPSTCSFRTIRRSPEPTRRAGSGRRHPILVRKTAKPRQESTPQFLPDLLSAGTGTLIRVGDRGRSTTIPGV